MCVIYEDTEENRYSFNLYSRGTPFSLYPMGAINNISGEIHTEDMLMALSNHSDVVVLDTYTFVGNSGGTGNHCDLLTAAVVRNDTGNINSFNYATDKCADYILSLSELGESYQEWSEKLDFPHDETDCYLLIKIDSASFKDNILGH